MTVVETLAKTGISRVDAEILLAEAMQRDRTWLFAHGEVSLSPEEEILFHTMIDRRKTGEPVAYIVGRKEFHGREFLVSKATLIPRPATELLVEQVLSLLQGEHVERIREIDSQIVTWTDVWGNADDVPLIVDVGTGSGCIGITLACELPALHIIATDISEEALMIAQKNAHSLHVGDRIEFRKGDALNPVMNIDQPFLIVSNPPYIPVGKKLDHDVAAFEPSSALFAGPDGTDVIRNIVTQAKSHPHCRGYVIECRAEQAR